MYRSLFGEHRMYRKKRNRSPPAGTITFATKAAAKKRASDLNATFGGKKYRVYGTRRTGYFVQARRPNRRLSH